MSILRKERKAKLFSNGGSQAVRIPKDLQFPGKEVYIIKRGSTCILSQKPLSWDLFFENASAVSDDFDYERDQTPPQSRESL